MSTEALTTETRYEWYGALAIVAEYFGSGGMSATAPGVMRCRSCGSLLAAGDEDLHERLHPRVTCQRACGDMGCAEAGIPAQTAPARR
jgi:hypothetical protein